MESNLEEGTGKLFIVFERLSADSHPWAGTNHTPPARPGRPTRGQATGGGWRTIPAVSRPEPKLKAPAGMKFRAGQIKISPGKNLMEVFVPQLLAF
jgi:hypothetical protein